MATRAQARPHQTAGAHSSSRPQADGPWQGSLAAADRAGTWCWSRRPKQACGRMQASAPFCKPRSALRPAAMCVTLHAFPYQRTSAVPACSTGRTAEPALVRPRTLAPPERADVPQLCEQPSARVLPVRPHACACMASLLCADRGVRQQSQGRHDESAARRVQQ